MPNDQNQQPSASDQFWLMTGGVPSGPFTVAQVHAEMAAGRATWQTPACPLSGGIWLPLMKTPGIGPDMLERDPADIAPPPGSEAKVTIPACSLALSPVPVDARPDLMAAPTPAAGSAPVAGSEAARMTKPPGKAAGVLMRLASLAVVGILGFGIYEWVRPLTPIEVCLRLEATTTAAGAGDLVTPRMRPLIDTVLADKSASDPNDTFELTREIDGPRPDMKLVGFRGTWFSQEDGARVQVEGHFSLLKSDRWRVDDMVFTGVEGRSLPTPMSLVDEHRRSVSLPNSRLSKPTTPGASPKPTNAYITVFNKVKELIGWGGITFILILVGIGNAMLDNSRKKSKA